MTLWSKLGRSGVETWVGKCAILRRLTLIDRRKVGPRWLGKMSQRCTPVNQEPGYDRRNGLETGYLNDTVCRKVGAGCSSVGFGNWGGAAMRTSMNIAVANLVGAGVFEYVSVGSNAELESKDALDVVLKIGNEKPG